VFLVSVLVALSLGLYVFGAEASMQLVAKHWDESTIYRAAHAFEQAGDWRNF
jgi:amidase